MYVALSIQRVWRLRVHRHGSAQQRARTGTMDNLDLSTYAMPPLVPVGACGFDMCCLASLYALCWVGISRARLGRVGSAVLCWDVWCWVGLD